MSQTTTRVETDGLTVRLPFAGVEIRASLAPHLQAHHDAARAAQAADT